MALKFKTELNAYVDTLKKSIAFQVRYSDIRCLPLKKFPFMIHFSVQENEVLVKITSAGTISIPKQFRKYMDVQKGEYVKLILGKDRLIVRKITIS